VRWAQERVKKRRTDGGRDGGRGGRREGEGAWGGGRSEADRSANEEKVVFVKESGRRVIVGTKGEREERIRGTEVCA